ncbi:right-handed parallel beta-helix repeat-containing protein [uncultured Methanobrevibacter sp.]|uniref:right-handed parallel beta-helix repeat-containing protein n=1 Tax=uncultured Methanobrevibacter sp. TaxID=253161 RepID=UPI0025D7ED70|nr:right-handed parallel beta-helix repeat-containing protein [uncultured Methanobrevibacter sp.]
MIFRNYINFRKSTLLLLLVALTIFVTLGTISATDVNNDSAAIDGGVIYGKFYQDNDSIAVENFENSNNNISFSDKEILGSAGDGTFTDLQKMINNARAGSTISLEKNYIYNQGFSTDGITINKALTINGNGHTIDASGQSRIFNTNSELTFDNIVFKNGKTMDGGAAIKTERFLFIKNSIFMGNDAYDGGAIYSSKNINVTNCIFMNNKADGSGFNQCEGGAIWTEEGTVEVDNSTFIGNYAYDYGGAIYANTVHTNSKSYFINNTVDDNKGGAIFTWNAYIVGTIFEGNAAYLRGGAIYNVRGITVINSTFRNNKAEGASVSQCGGGAIFTSSDEATVNVDNCTFIGNHAADYGGAIYGLYSCYISSSSFIGNYADDNCGGAIYAYRDELGTLWTMQMTIYDSIFDGNHAYDDGGAIYTNVVSVCVSNSIFRNNYADGASSSQCYGGAILVEGDTSYSGARSLQINNATFIGNHAHDYGGAVYADVVGWGDAPSYFINNYVEDNQGGAIYANKFSNDVSRAVFIGNEVRANDDGGAIYINKANSITFSQCYFERNKCGDEGGAIYLDSRSSVISLKNNVFIDNSAGDKGQIVYNWGDYGEISENWYGTNNPSFNDQFKEWGFFRDDDHSDSNYVITKLSLSDNPRVGHTYNLTVDFLSKNSAKLSGNLFGFDAKFSADNGAEISNHQIGTNNVTSEITFWSAGLTTINATVNKQDLKLLSMSSS